MPNIPTYDQQTPGLQPTELGIQSLTQSAYRARALFDQAAGSREQEGREIGGGIASAGAAAVQFETHREVSAGAAHGAKVLSDLTQSWNDTAKNADPNDPSVAAKWREEVLEPTLDQFGKGFNTEGSQQWAEHFTAGLRQHLYEKTSADMSSLAGIAVESNIRTVANTFSNTAQSDPSAVPFLLESVDHQIGGMVDSSPTLRPEDAARVKGEVAEKTKEQIVKSGVYGAILSARDPEAAAAAWAKKYPQYVSGVEAETFARAAKAQARTNLAMEKQTEFYSKSLATQQVDAARNKIWSDNVSVDPSGKVTIKPDFFRQAAQLPGQYQAAPNATETARTLLDWGERQQKPGKPVSDPAAASDLDTRMFSADRPTTEMDVLRAEADGRLSRQDAHDRLALVKERDAAPIKDPVFKTAMDGARSVIESTIPGVGKVGADKYAGFMNKFLTEYQRQSRAGTLPANALDLTDPKSLISQTIAPFRNDLSTSISANGGVSAPPLPVYTAPAKPAATPEVGTRRQFKQGWGVWDGKKWVPAPAGNGPAT